MRSGLLRNWVTFRSPEGDRTIQRHAHVWATSGSETETGDSEVSRVSYAIRIRQAAGTERPGPRWRITWQGSELSVLAVQDPTGRGRELLITAEEIR